MRESTARRMGFPKRRKGRENSQPVSSATAKAFDAEVDKWKASEEYKRRERLMLEADALEKEVNDYYDFD